MANFTTNRCRYLELERMYRSGTTFHLALCTAATTPSEDINTLGELTEISAGAGYTTGGITLTGNSTDFPTLTEDDTNDKAIIVLRDITFTASGGPIPLTGSGAAYAVLTATGGTVSQRAVLRIWDIRDGQGTARQVSDGQSIIIPGLTIERRK